MSNPTELPDLDHRTNGMTDSELIGYCELHCETERALFNADQVNRMIHLAGYPDWCVRSVTGWMTLHEHMAKLCELARARRAQPEGEAPAPEVPDFYRKVLSMPEGPGVIGPAAQQAAAPGSLDLMNADEMAALRRFDETCQDGEGYDVPKAMMQRLAAIGVVRRTSGSYYETTEFGLRVLDQPAPSAPGTPEAPAGTDAKDAARYQWLRERWVGWRETDEARSTSAYRKREKLDEWIDRAAQLDGGQGEGKAHA